MSHTERPKSNVDIFFQKGETVFHAIFVIWFVVAVTMIIMGGVFWADGEWELSVNCDLKKKINQSLGIYTPAEIEVFYQACKADANAELRWALPVTTVGAALLVLLFLPTASLLSGLGGPVQSKPYQQSRKSLKREIM
jgi:hypothetical protein